jgi:hypothetical protein
MDIRKKYKPAKGLVDGREVGETVSNMSSIPASLVEYEVLRGIREVPFSAFKDLGPVWFYSVQQENWTRELAKEISASGRVDPLIVVEDQDGPYILEGGHRFDALRIIGAESFPALVVLDLESLAEL